MKRVFIAVCIAAAVAASVSAAPTRPWRIIERDAQSVTLEFVTAAPVLTQAGGATHVHIAGFITERLEGLPVLPVRRFLVEVPHERAIELTVLESGAVPLEGAAPQIWPRSEPDAEAPPRPFEESAARGGDFAELAAVETLRGRRVALVDLYPVQWNPSDDALVHARRIVIRLSWRPAQAPPAPPARRPEDRFIIDAGRWSGAPQHPPLRAAERPPFEFARSDRWIKLTVSRTGLHRISYEDFTAAGLNPGTIDPGTLRIFTSGPLQQPDSIRMGGSFEQDYRLTEIDVLYSGMGSGTLMPGESITFYALAATGWRNHIDPGAGADKYYKHRYDEKSVYWLTWGGSFDDLPGRMDGRSVAPSGFPDLEVTTYRHRIHVEQETQYDPLYTDDFWFWRRMNPGSTAFTNEFQCSEVAGGTGSVRTVGFGPYVRGNTSNEAECRVNGEYAGRLSWVVYSSYRPDTLDAPLTSLGNGANTFTLSKPLGDVMYVQWYEIAYDRYLRPEGGRLDFFSPSASGTASFTLSGFPADEPLILLDVTDHAAPVILSDWQGSGGTAVFEDFLAGQARHYHASASSGLLKPLLSVVSLGPGILPSLRDEPAPHMVIVYHNSFRAAALRLQQHRSTALPGVPSPVVRAVDVEHVYNNFSGGQKDPLAIRNYLKFLYDSHRSGGEPLLRYVLLIGNCTYDPRNILGRSNDFVPVYINPRYISEGVEDDDFLVKLDSGPDRLIDVAIGRMPVLTRRESDVWAERIVRYESGVDHGPWRNKVVIVADDEYSTNTNNDFIFTIDAEWMAADDGVFPSFADLRKIYLHHYPFVGAGKPGARDDLLREWNDGALVVNFAGHGSPLQLADERVLQISDLFSLMNGAKAPLFLAFSCTVADLESPYQRSMGQQLPVLEAGGAIAVIAAVAPTIAIPNRNLNYLFFDYLFAEKDSTYTEPIGTALLMAKTDQRISGYIGNNAMYALLGDPALTLALPALTVEHETAGIDTMETGYRYTLEGSVILNGRVHSAFDGTAELIVQESIEMVSSPIVWWGTPTTLDYRLPGKDIFRGSVDVNEGRFSADFVVPLRCRTGPRARVRSYVSGAGSDGVGAIDTLSIVRSAAVPPNDGPPRVRLYFAGQATRVKQGARLIAEIFDEDGIAILGADPQSSIFLEFNRSGLPTFVTEYFSYDHGSSTTGRVEYPLHGGFEPGPHEVMLRAFDNLGAAGADTLAFELIEEGLYTISDVFNMPNPFREATNIIFQLSSRADVTLRVYNLSGVEIRQFVIFGQEGFNSIYWDGRDHAGDRVANGTYLYVLEVSFRDSYHRTESVTGKAVLLR